jgi:type IV secretory pathway VirB9-like protein
MDGRKMFFSKKPHVKSGSAYEINVVQNPDNTYTITYNSEMCTQMDDNSIEVSHILEGRRVKNVFYFTVDRK